MLDLDRWGCFSVFGIIKAAFREDLKEMVLAANSHD